jgi:hypothetical protein
MVSNRTQREDGKYENSIGKNKINQNSGSVKWIYSIQNNGTQKDFIKIGEKEITISHEN